MPGREAQDWTVGPAKWAAVFVLGGVSALGITASFRAGSGGGWGGGDGRGPAPLAAVRAVESSKDESPETGLTTPLPAAQPLVESKVGAVDRQADAARAPSSEPSPTPRTAPTTSKAPPAPSLAKINLNTANAAELERLPRIGPAMAKRIIEFRTTRGPFRHIDDLDAVPGIGPRTLEQLRPLVSVE